MGKIKIIFFPSLENSSDDVRIQFVCQRKKMLINLLLSASRTLCYGCT